MIVIDSNSLVVLLIGSIDPRLFKNHNRTSIYDEKDYYKLLTVISSFNRLLILPNVWTEVDNLLNDFNKSYKEKYIYNLLRIIKETNEKYLESSSITANSEFYDLGLTDSLILKVSLDNELLITADSKLSDYALANGVKVFDLVREKNNNL